jgi:cation diffusion facilitator CzcD-associated flavoprotein CzcO
VKQLTVLPESKSKVSPQEEEWPQIRLEWECDDDDDDDDDERSEVFDAVYVCNGRYDKPSFLDLPGLDQYFKGEITHSVEYDDPSQFDGKTVLCVGGRASGSDLARGVGAMGTSNMPSSELKRMPRTSRNQRHIGRSQRVRKNSRHSFFSRQCIYFPFSRRCAFFSFPVHY